MTGLWPSERAGGRRTKGTNAGSTVPMDWRSGWLFMLALAATVAVGAALAWPVLAMTLDSFQDLSRVLEHVSK